MAECQTVFGGCSTKSGEWMDEYQENTKGMRNLLKVSVLNMHTLVCTRVCIQGELAWKI